MLGYQTKLKARRTIKKTFQLINDLVVPTMGAKGMMVAIKDGFGKGTITDDGVTVAKEGTKLDGFEQMIAVDMIEAAGNTEKEALDGTTLTILLTNEMYKWGYKQMLLGKHPQVVADILTEEVKQMRDILSNMKMNLADENVINIATISTKMPYIGKIIEEAYKYSGKEMNIIIEHDREDIGVRVEKTEGFSIDSGYMSDAMKALCPDGDKWEAEDCHIVLMKEGIMTQAGLGKFFTSIPGDKIKDPFVFIMNPNFNPNTLRLLIDTLIKNKMNYQFIFVNEAKMEDVYMDLSAVTLADVQDASNGIGELEFSNCGSCTKITIEQDKSILVYDNTLNKKEISNRIKSYKKKLDKKYKVTGVDLALYTKRLGALENGVVKIKVGVPTITEYQTLRLKLDDAIGAVKKSFEKGTVIGGGRALLDVYTLIPNLMTKRILLSPIKTICRNAGVKISPRKLQRILKIKGAGIDVRSGIMVDLLKSGIIDSYLSIDEALKNSSSIASSYIRTNTLIKKEEITHNK